MTESLNELLGYWKGTLDEFWLKGRITDNGTIWERYCSFLCVGSSVMNVGDIRQEKKVGSKGNNFEWRAVRDVPGLIGFEVEEDEPTGGAGDKGE